MKCSNQQGLRKKTCTHILQCKEDLVLACLQYRHDRFCDWFAQLGDFKGCFFINASAEFSDPMSGMNQLCCPHKNHIKDLFAHCLRRNIAQDAKIQRLSQQLCILKEGCISEARVRHNLNAPLEVIPLLETLFAETP